MSEVKQPKQRKRKRLWLALAALAAILAVLIVPPLVSVSRYKARVTHLISATLGRPVRLSSVEVRLLPRPGFVLNDLTVAEDPAYGAEPVLQANTVTASIRLLSLWRGRLEIDSISMDEASLNLVRSAPGLWNLDSILRTAAAQTQSAGSIGPAAAEKPVHLPYFEATHSRINIKNGVEKLPFSLVDAKISLEQQSPGEWRIRLRGQPARTDLSLEQADTGLVRLEAELRSASELRQMPLRLDLDWREAQLGQLTRLLLGADAGWRGDLTGQLHIEGSADAAQIKTRLRATGVHRAEFAPAAPMDFDANCSLVAHFSARAIDNLVCDSPLGAGHLRVTGNLPGGIGREPNFSVALEKIPVAAALDALRTVRSGLASGIEASGSASGTLSYAPASPEVPASAGHRPSLKPELGPLTGSLAVEGFQLSGGGLSEPIQIPKILLQPMSVSPGQQANDLQPQMLGMTVAFPAGGTTPLTIHASLSLSGYLLTVSGQASIRRARELARVAGFADAAALNELAGGPVSVDLTAEGPWMLTARPLPLLDQTLAHTLPSRVLPPAASADSLAGTVTLRNANWKAAYLVNAVLISQATLHISAGQLRWEPVVFSYGPIKGTASITVPAACEAPLACPPSFQLQFGALDAGLLQAAFLGAQARGTMLSTLIERLRPTAAPAWPRLEGTVKAESLLLGPVTLHQPSATITTLANGADISAFDAGLLGGRVHGSGVFHAAATAKEKPSYQFEAQFDKLSPQAVGQLLGVRATGSAFDGHAKIELTGFTSGDLAASATGALHFEWQRGSVAATSGSVPPSLARFDRWTADSEIANGAVTLKENQVKRGASVQPVQAAVPLADPPRIVFAAPKQAQAKR